jgi:2-amino-4-hydroxy-6-hydroxymethyldihydropteridine diphosphokinase
VSETAYIGLGSNLGDRESFLKQAISRLGSVDGLEITAASAIYVSDPDDMADDSPPFLNQVVRAECAFTPEELLRTVEQIETELGRTDKGAHLARTIDIDILMFGGHHIKTDRLEIPHPRMLRRPFVLVPLLEIDSTLVHPVTGKQLSQYVTSATRLNLEVFKDNVARQV